MREMVSDISKLHKVLKMYLQAGEVQTIFGRIVALLNEELPRHFAAVEPSGLSIAGAKQCVLAGAGARARARAPPVERRTRAPAFAH
jgi:hypothetical protein